MALPIASIPVLTGEVAQRFEERAQANYQRYLNRTEEQKKADEAKLEKKFADLYSKSSMIQRNLKASIVETLT